jgi:hypothetical protein
MYVIETLHPLYGWKFYYRPDHIWSEYADQAVKFDNPSDAEQFIHRHGVDEGIYQVHVSLIDEPAVEELVHAI